jgi:ferredoxin--NADP+ reductase
VRERVLEVDEHQFNTEIGQSIGVLVTGPEDFGSPVHHGLCSVADAALSERAGTPEITIVVRRCNDIDDYSGDTYLGMSSN